MGWQSQYAQYFTARSMPLRQLAYAMCGDWHLADDLVQHTFLQLYRHWRRVEQATLDAYARKVLVNAYLSHRRKYWREYVVADPPDRAADGPADDHSAAIGAALAALPPRQRALVVLRHMEDMSISEAAELLGISEGTVKSQTARGLEKLRAALKQPALEEFRG
ncbi:DNA-directed RNA polymerase sigma-70 factor [Rhizocola hellebori]|uniref:DNA-directed RNA polymerase sigma-70 factor n=2 Tax=Rhizocola hellebori TaxID=1392758 RepID=A0A8J3Q327_9ACTN|nr:DNA-directed RNA polymerase sigma-70 factor [Rhizocola hellebori]